MSFPRYVDVHLALLLELVRLNRSVRPHETYERVTRHFPNLTEEDQTALRKDGRTRVWINKIHWARNALRVQDVLDGSAAGIWATNAKARALLERWLTARGGRDIAAFIDSERALSEYLGRAWAGEGRAPRPRTDQRSITTLHPTEATLDSRATTDAASLMIREHQMVEEDLLRRLRAMDEYAFENFIARVLDALGFRETVVVGRPGDGGVDVRCVLRNELIEATVAVQVKRQQGNVGPKEISYLRDRWSRRADKLLFVTTSGFTPGAREVAEEEGLKPVTLLDGKSLARLMIAHRIGVSSQVVERLALDEEFFSS